MARKVWFHLVDAATRGAFLDHKASSVPCDGFNDIEDLRNKIHVKYAHTRPQETNILAHLTADQLDVYANRAAYDDKVGQPLEEDLAIGALGASKKGALIVVVPTQQRSGVADMQAEVPTSDFRLQALQQDVVWYGVRGSSGMLQSIDLQDERTLSRRSLTNVVINRLVKKHVLLVKSPPMTGKSSLAALVSGKTW